MHEVAMVFDKEGRAMRWSGGESASLPDSSDLWNFLWENREQVMGVAHSHPWDGPTRPSGTDLTTYTAIERGLGRKLVWPIITMTHDQYFSICDSNEDVYFEVFAPFHTEEWKNNIEELRRRSRGEEHG
jgi:hypothetical protein